jgi:predicted O-methyltransferase YrrM
MGRDINSVFDLATEDILYAVEEGVIDASENYYGKTLFGNEIQQYEDKSAFSSGILLFKNCEKMKFLFGEINECMRTRKDESDFYDQPFIVYNAFKYNLYDNQKLKQYALNQNTCFSSKYVMGKIINHFYGDPTAKQIHIKIDKMRNILQLIKTRYISHIIDITKQYINENLLPIIRNIGEPFEGNIFMQHLTTDCTDAFQNKVNNISNLLLNRNIQNVMEIGFNSGFSALLMLNSNPTVKLTCFDLGHHKYTLLCYEKMRETFGDRIQLIIGDSAQTLKNVNDRFDLIHIDGGHSTEAAESDIIHSYRLSKKGAIFIMDDSHFPNLREVWDKYIRVYDLKPLNIYTYNYPHHDIKYIAR